MLLFSFFFKVFYLNWITIMGCTLRWIFASFSFLLWGAVSIRSMHQSQSYISDLMSAEGNIACLFGSRECGISIHTFCVTSTVFTVSCLVPAMYLRVFLGEKRWRTTTNMLWVLLNFTATWTLGLAPPRYFSTALLATWQMITSAEEYRFIKITHRIRGGRLHGWRGYSESLGAFERPLMAVSISYKH